MVRQESHLTHSTSVRTRRSSGGVVCSIDFLSRLNQAMRESRQFSVISFKFREEKPRAACSSCFFESSVSSSQCLIVDPPLSQYTLGVGVFHLAHLGNQVGEFDELGMGVAAGANDVHALRAAFQGFDDLLGVEHLVADGVVDFVEYNEVVLATINGVASRLPAFLPSLDVFRIRFSA